MRTVAIWNPVVTVTPGIEILMMGDDSYDIDVHRYILEIALNADFAWIIAAISDENTQTLCQTCNEVKTVLAGDRVPQALYKTEQQYREVHDLLDPIYDTVFGKEEWT